MEVRTMALLNTGRDLPHPTGECVSLFSSGSQPRVLADLLLIVRVLLMYLLLMAKRNWSSS